MPIRVVYRFTHSRSAGLPEAIRIAKKLGVFSSFGAKTSERRYQLELDLEAAKLEPLAELLSISRSWKGSKLEVDGAPAVMNFFGGSLRKVAECYRQRERSGLGDRYCLGQDAPGEDPKWFGCRFAQGVRLVDRPDSGFSGVHAIPRGDPPEWWRFGQLDPDAKSFLVDKEEIVRTVIASTAPHPCAVCPAYSLGRLEAAAYLLPSNLVIDKHSGTWGLRYSDIDETRPIGVYRLPPLGWTREEDRRFGESQDEDDETN